MAARKKTGTKAARKPTRKPPQRRSPRRYGAGLWLRLPVLEQRQLDIVGLALVALGVFLAFIFYGDWNGGKVGGALADGFRYLVGVVAYVVPAALVAGGAVVVLRPFLPNSRPFASGAVCLFAALTLALAAGTFGLGPGRALRDSTTELSAALPRRGDEHGVAGAGGDPLAPPEPSDRELVVRATHVEAPPLDAATRFPDLFGRTEGPVREDAATADEH